MDTFTEYLPEIAFFVSLLALAISSYFGWRSHKRGERDNKLNQDQFAKIKEDSQKAHELAVNPSWFASRMDGENWWFGLLTTSGVMIGIEKIYCISDDGKWLTVTLLTKEEIEQAYNRPELKYVTAVADDRRTASVQVSNIVLTFELLSS